VKCLNTKLVGKPRTRWEDVFRRDTSQILGIRGWGRQAENRKEWRRLLRKTKGRRDCSAIDGLNWNGIYIQGRVK
jgi:hypothetical protein